MENEKRNKVKKYLLRNSQEERFHRYKTLRNTKFNIILKKKDFFISNTNQKKLYIGSDSWVTSRPKIKTKINSGLDFEFNS